MSTWRDGNDDYPQRPPPEEPPEVKRLRWWSRLWIALGVACLLLAAFLAALRLCLQVHP